MALIKCGECGAQLSDKDSACPKCGSKVPDTVTLRDGTTAQVATTESGLSIIHWIGIVTTCGLLTLWFMVDRPGSGITSTPTVRSDASSMAHVQCMEFVKDRLKSPSSASFSTVDRATTRLPDHQYIIRTFGGGKKCLRCRIEEQLCLQREVERKKRS